MEKQNFSNALTRLLAHFIDVIIVSIPLLIAYFSTQKIISIAFFGVYLIVDIYNRIYLVVKKRSTLGMQFMEIKLFKFTDDNLVESPLSYKYIIFRGIVSDIVSYITFGIDCLFIFFTKRRQTLHDLIFWSVFVNNPSRKKYSFATTIIVVAVLTFIFTRPIFSDERIVLTYKIHYEYGILDARDKIEEKLKNVLTLDQYQLHQYHRNDTNEVEIILPKNIDKNIVITDLSSQDNLKFQEFINDEWKDSEINESYIDSAEPVFGKDGSIFVLIKLNPDGQKFLESFTERNIGKNIRITLNDQVLIYTIVKEKITNGSMLASFEHFTDAKKFSTEVNLAKRNSLELIKEEHKKVLRKGFVWLKK